MSTLSTEPFLPRRALLRASLCSAAALALTACSKQESANTPAATPARGALSPAEAYTLAGTGTGFTVGSMMAANAVYVFFDTTCPHCAQLWQASQPLLNRIKMVWMPLGLLRPQSGPQGATILMASNPAAAMADHEAKLMANGGGITPAASIPDDLMAKIKANTEIFQKLGADSVPLIVFKNVRTGGFGQHNGALDTQGLAGMLGI